MQWIDPESACVIGYGRRRIPGRVGLVATVGAGAGTGVDLSDLHHLDVPPLDVADTIDLLGRHGIPAHIAHRVLARGGSEAATRLVTTPDSRGHNPRLNGEGAAAAYLADHRASFGTSRQDEFQRVSTTEGTAGTAYVAYERVRRGLRVVGGDVVLSLDESAKVTGRSATLTAPVRLASVTPKVGAGQAKRTAQGQVDTVLTTSKPELVVHAQRRPRLAWETVVTGASHGQPTELTV